MPGVERAGLTLPLLLTAAACQRPEHTLTYAAALLPRPAAIGISLVTSVVTLGPRLPGR